MSNKTTTNAVDADGVDQRASSVASGVGAGEAVGANVSRRNHREAKSP